jgi:hypothetical protein
MVDAITASWHGNNYQARVFWENALNLLLPGSCVSEVTFEANGPKSFDDVIVRYDPAIARSGPLKVPADYHQVKWHVGYGGRFTYADFIDPDFIGAKSLSLLERLRDAKNEAAPGSCFTFLTTYQFRDDDPLAPLVSGVDKTLLLHRLFDGTGPRGKMGKIRKLWRDHLGFGDDDDTLRELLTGFRIVQNHRSLDELRSQINITAHAVGMLTCHAADSDFRYDELARQLKVRQINALSREALLALCESERMFAPTPVADSSPLPRVAIRSFIGAPADVAGVSAEYSLILTDAFNARYLVEDQSWQDDIRPRIEAFLTRVKQALPRFELVLDAHASIAFLAGTLLDFKSSTDVTLIQKHRVGSTQWRADDGQEGAPLEVIETKVGKGSGMAVLIQATHDVSRQVEAYRKAKLRGVGTLLSFTPIGGPSPRSILGGSHAAAIADQITREVRARRHDDDAVVHIFGACPNTLFFYLGQHHRGIAPVIIHEYDFDRRGNRSYLPSFFVD